jgi:hypothetical protein
MRSSITPRVTLRLIEAQRPFLDRQTKLYFETSEIIGRLLVQDFSEPADWWKAERRFWALYFGELALIASMIFPF